MNSIKSVSVCGLGKLGACMAATFAARGFNVVGVDIDPEKIRQLGETIDSVRTPFSVIQQFRHLRQDVNTPLWTQNCL